MAPSGVFRLLVAEYDGRILAGGIFHFLVEIADLVYNGSDESYLDLRPNQAVYWKAVQLCIGGGYPYLDFALGKVVGSLAEFKAGWTAEPAPRFRYTYPAGASASQGDGEDGGAPAGMGLFERLATEQHPLLTRSWKALRWRSPA
ncbi:MAG: GNAT family N-acetyltransferase [Actinomycetota bacterium]